jgi:hypothetical protein
MHRKLNCREIGAIPTPAITVLPDRVCQRKRLLASQVLKLRVKQSEVFTILM